MNRQLVSLKRANAGGIDPTNSKPPMERVPGRELLPSHSSPDLPDCETRKATYHVSAPLTSRWVATGRVEGKHQDYVLIIVVATTCSIRLWIPFAMPHRYICDRILRHGNSSLVSTGRFDLALRLGTEMLPALGTLGRSFARAHGIT